MFDNQVTLDSGYSVYVTQHNVYLNLSLLTPPASESLYKGFHSDTDNVSNWASTEKQTVNKETRMCVQA